MMILLIVICEAGIVHSALCMPADDSGRMRGHCISIAVSCPKRPQAILHGVKSEGRRAHSIAGKGQDCLELFLLIERSCGINLPILHWLQCTTAQNTVFVHIGMQVAQNLLLVCHLSCHEHNLAGGMGCSPQVLGPSGHTAWGP